MEEILEKVQNILKYAEQMERRSGKHVVFPNKGSEIVLREQDICYIERKKRITRICMEKGEELTTLKLTEIMEYLNKDKFVRCHNSFIVNLDKVHIFNRSEFVLDNEEIVPISRSRYEEVRQAFDKWSKI